MQIFTRFAGEGRQIIIGLIIIIIIRQLVRRRNMSIKRECGRWKWRFSFLSFTVFRTFYIHGHTTAFTWCYYRWPWRYFKVIRLFHIKFLKNGSWYGKSYCRLLIGNHALAFDWCHSWWPWSTLEGISAYRLSFPHPFQLSLLVLGFRVARSPSNSWASCKVSVFIVFLKVRLFVAYFCLSLCVLSFYSLYTVLYCCLT